MSITLSSSVDLHWDIGNILCCSSFVALQISSSKSNEYTLIMMFEGDVSKKIYESSVEKIVQSITKYELIYPLIYFFQSKIDYGRIKL